MNRFTIWCFIICSCLALNMQAQIKKTYWVSGVVADSSNHKPLHLVTVGIYRSTELQKPIAVVTTNDKGIYSLNVSDSGSYSIFFTHAAYNQVELTISIADSMPGLNMDTVHLSAFVKMLRGVIVTALQKKPLIVQEDDRIIYNAEEDPSNAGITAIELLRKTPLVSVDGEDNIRLNGQTNFKILLNGKETGMFSNNPQNVLRGFPSNLVKRIEVITNPSSKYDAEGVGGIINIITKKKIVGYNGFIGINYNKFNTIPFAGINMKYGKWGFSASGGYNNENSPDADFYAETISLNPLAYSRRLSNGKQDRQYFSNWANAELSYDLDSLTSFSLYGSIGGGHGNTDRYTNFDLVLPTIIDTVKSSFNYYSKINAPVFSGGMDYIQKFKRDKNRELSIKYYTQYSRNNTYDTSGEFSTSNARFIINDNNSNDKQITLQADYVHPLKPGKVIEAGFKSIYRNAIADYQNYHRDDSMPEYRLFEANSDYFNYRQNVYGAYATYRFSWKKISARLGARLEHTDLKGNFRKSNAIVKQQYNNLLPNIYLSRQYKNIHTVSLSYGMRLARPYIYNLNPFVNNTDTLNINYGNPNLDRQTAHNIEIGYTAFKGVTSIAVRLSENFSGNQIIRYTLFDDATGIRKTTYENIGATAMTSLSVNISTRYKDKWYLYLNGNLQYLVVKNRWNAAQRNSGFGGTGSISTGYKFNSRVSTSVFWWFSQPQVSLQGRSGIYYTFTWNAVYYLVKDKLSIAIAYTNPFPKYFPVTSTWSDINFRSYTETRIYRRALGITAYWNFGKLSENVSRKKGVKNDDLKEKE